MDLHNYFRKDGPCLQFEREQASHFAKDVAGDFNPIHDVDARRFCVPGDLLFAVLLQQYGLYRNMQIEFAGMVTEQSKVLVEQSPGATRLVNDSGADYLIAKHDGRLCGDEHFIHAITAAYVRFSGQTFPHILVPLMREKDAMINPARPMVMYRQMSLSLDICQADHIELCFRDAEFEVSGKKGEVSLHFDIRCGEQTIGSGMKNMLLSGLRPYDQQAIDDITAQYQNWKTAWTDASTATS